jgi:hypothetical protein
MTNVQVSALGSSEPIKSPWSRDNMATRPFQKGRPRRIVCSKSSQERGSLLIACVIFVILELPSTSGTPPQAATDHGGPWLRSFRSASTNSDR